MRLTLDVDIAPERYPTSGSVADALAAIAEEYDRSGNEFGNEGGIRWTLTFKEGA